MGQKQSVQADSSLPRSPRTRRSSLFRKSTKDSIERECFVNNSTKDPNIKIDNLSPKDVEESPFQEIEENKHIHYEGNYHSESINDENKNDQDICSHPIYIQSKSLYETVQNEYSKKQNEHLKASSTINNPRLDFPSLKEGNEKEKSEYIDWNREFEKWMYSTQTIERLYNLDKLSSDFIYSASAFSEIIISERCLPYEFKTIKPVNVGGIAGGQKFICQGIIFKFAVDTPLNKEGTRWMYGGDSPDDEAAMKGASNELKALHNLFREGVNFKIKCPLMAMIDHKGFRILAMSFLPIDKSTIIYGSNNGKNVHASDPEFNDAMEKIAKLLNMKGHYVGNHGEKQFLYFPGDVEGHRGKDGNYYLIDLQRVLPPEPPIKEEIKCIKRSRDVFYKLFRPELMRFSPKPLSSDAFSKWGDADENREESEKELIELNDILHEKVIPGMAAQLDSSFNSFEMLESCNYQSTKEVSLILDRFVISLRIHRDGVSWRHIGYVRKFMKSEFGKNFILSLACSRVMKSEIRYLWRKQMEVASSPTDFTFRKILADYLNENLFFSNGIQNGVDSEFWGNWIKNQLEKKYPFILDEYEKDSTCQIFTKIFPKVIYVELMRMLGCKLSRIFEKVISKKWENSFELQAMDITDLGSRNKQLFALPLSRGVYYAVKGSKDPSLLYRMLNISASYLRIASESVPLCPGVTGCWARVIKDIGCNTELNKLSNLCIELADEKFDQVTDLFPAKEFFPHMKKNLEILLKIKESQGNEDEVERIKQKIEKNNEKENNSFKMREAHCHESYFSLFESFLVCKFDQ